MRKDDIKINKERISFSKQIKRKVLLEVAKGKKPQEALFKYLPFSLNDITNDKKYASKLIYKWKKEMYINREVLFLLNHDVSDNAISEEIFSIGEDIEEEINLDNAIEEAKSKFLEIIKKGK